jgi:hypothetical protein
LEGGATECAEQCKPDHRNEHCSPHEHATHAWCGNFTLFVETIEERRAGIVAHTLPFAAFLFPGAMLVQVMREDRRDGDTYTEGNYERNDCACCIEDFHTSGLSLLAL